MAKAQTLRNRLLRRIQAGDYATRPIPPERQFASELGVSYMTLRKVANALVDEGWLARQANGRLAINQSGVRDHAGPQLTILVPSFHSLELANWMLAVDRVCAGRGWRVRPLHYAHWEDPIIAETLSGSAGVFLLPNVEAPSPTTERLLRSTSAPLVVLDQDWSGYGFPSVLLYPRHAMRLLVEHLAGLGHRRVDCLNVQARDAVIAERIDAWRLAIADLGLLGELHDRPTASYQSPLPQAHALAADLLSRSWSAIAAVATTMPAAIGCLRACHERGRRIPAELSLAVINGEGLADMLVPSITAVEGQAPDAALEHCLDWMASGRPWTGPLLMRPDAMEVTSRESSDLAPKTTTVRVRKKYSKLQ